MIKYVAGKQVNLTTEDDIAVIFGTHTHTHTQ